MTNKSTFNINFSKKIICKLNNFYLQHAEVMVLVVALFFSTIASVYYTNNGTNLAYNDAMSRLNIARRVTDNLTPGLSQLGTVWLPLPHLLMLPTIWNERLWHSGLSGLFISSISFIITILFVYKSVKLLTSSNLGSIFASLLVVSNTNFLYLQTTSLTEPLFIAISTLSLYYFLLWLNNEEIHHLLQTAFFVMLSTLVRYDGWALLIFFSFTLFLKIYLQTKKIKKAEGKTILFISLAGLGIALWFLWNQVIFGDPLYFATGEFSAKSQQDILEIENRLPAKGNIILSVITYYFAAIENNGLFPVLITIFGLTFLFIKTSDINRRLFYFVLIAPLSFNIVALYFGHSVIHLPLLGNFGLFNVRYGLIVLPTLAIVMGALISNKNFLIKYLVCFFILFQVFANFTSRHIITLEDGLGGASSTDTKNLAQWMNNEFKDNDDHILVSAYSYDAVLFSSKIPLRRYIHEGNDEIWKAALKYPDQYARYIIMRSGDSLDLVSKNIENTESINNKYNLVYQDDFANIFEIKQEFLPQLQSTNSKINKLKSI